MISAPSSASLGSDCVGHIIDGRFTLLRCLGETPQGSVFLTQLEDQLSPYAVIKLIPADAVDAEACLAQWNEARAFAHPHLMRLFDAGRCEVDGQDQLYVVTEYADEVLSDILAERPLSPGETREMLGPVLDALSWLHARNVIYGQLKPSAIMVVGDQLKLAVDDVLPLSQPGISDAPETASGLITPAADVWSLGVVLVEALTRQLPIWDRASGLEPPIPRSIPMPFFGIARECLQLDPAWRLTLPGVRAALDPPPVPQPTARNLETPSPRARALLLASGVLVVGAAVAALVLTSQHLDLSPPDALEASAPPPVTTQASAPAPPTTPIPAPRPATTHISTHPPAPTRTSTPLPAPTDASAPQPAAVEASTPSPAATQASTPPPAATQASTPPSADNQPPSPSPAAPLPTGAVIPGAVAYRAAPYVPQPILDAIQGHLRVSIRVQVDPDGHVSGAAIDDPGTSLYFASRALAAAQNWKFTPAQVDGRPVPSTWILHFTFGQTKTTVTPEETAP
jgi:TonB family protein